MGALTAGATSARRIGLFGGTFDPVHRAHVAVARAALAQLDLTALWWVPAGDPWQKRAVRRVTPAVHRAAMLELVLAGEPRQRVERCELERAGPSYTIDTVERLTAQHPGTQWVLVMGADQWCNLPTWHRWQDLVRLVELAVAPRAALPSQRPEATEPMVLEGVPHRMLQMPLLDVSSTALRHPPRDHPAHMPGGGHDAPSHDVPEVVARYIATHGLYREAS